MDNPFGFLIVGVGIFAFAAAALDWEFFMNHRKARGLTNLIGRKGTRIFYITLGLILAILGVLLAFGIIHSK